MKEGQRWKQYRCLKTKRKRGNGHAQAQLERSFAAAPRLGSEADGEVDAGTAAGGRASSGCAWACAPLMGATLAGLGCTVAAVGCAGKIAPALVLLLTLKLEASGLIGSPFGPLRLPGIMLGEGGSVRKRP